jgi:hypothetical protein
MFQRVEQKREVVCVKRRVSESMSAMCSAVVRLGRLGYNVNGSRNRLR